MEDETCDKVDALYEHTDAGVYGFFKDHRFLSNFWPASFVDFSGIRWKSSEAYYQAHKFLHHPETLPIFFQIQKADIKSVKKIARKNKEFIDPYFSYKKDYVMFEALMYKFTQNPDLLKLLKDTGSKHLVEANWWKDTYWGVFEGNGENVLGLMLEKVRYML